MNITEVEFNQYMHLLETEIKNNFKIHQQLSEIKTPDENGLKDHFKTQQHKYFLKWYELNERLRQSGKGYYLPQKVRDLSNCLIEVNNYKDLLKVA